MTTPKINTTYQGGSRYYTHPDTGYKAPGVTSVLDRLPKPFLKPWAAKEVATTAVAMVASGELGSMAARDPDGAIDYLKRSPDRNTRKAADIGTAAHGVFESLVLGRTVGKLTEDMRPFAAQYADLLRCVDVEPIRTEDTVWSEKHHYAGSFDLFAKVDGVPCWIDNKTTRSGVHAEVALQLAAYRAADYVFDEDTGEHAEIPKGDHGLVFHIRPEGWSIYEVPIGEDVFAYFLSLRHIFTWSQLERSIVPRKPTAKGSALGEAAA